MTLDPPDHPSPAVEEHHDREWTGHLDGLVDADRHLAPRPVDGAILDLAIFGERHRHLLGIERVPKALRREGRDALEVVDAHLSHRVEHPLHLRIQRHVVPTPVVSSLRP